MQSIISAVPITMVKWHIILSTLALISMGAAGIQAALLALQDYALRHHRRNILHFLPFLPPIETLEKYLFATIWVGFILLCMVFLSSLLFFGDIFIAPLREKTFLTLLALGVFGLLLWGRYQRGWRGRITIRWTFFGVLLLLIIYYSTGLLLHAA